MFAFEDGVFLSNRAVCAKHPTERYLDGCSHDGSHVRHTCPAAPDENVWISSDKYRRGFCLECTYPSFVSTLWPISAGHYDLIVTIGLRYSSSNEIWQGFVTLFTGWTAQASPTRRVRSKGSSNHHGGERRRTQIVGMASWWSRSGGARTGTHARDMSSWRIQGMTGYHAHDGRGNRNVDLAQPTFH